MRLASPSNCFGSEEEAGDWRRAAIDVTSARVQLCTTSSPGCSLAESFIIDVVSNTENRGRNFCF